MTYVPQINQAATASKPPTSNNSVQRETLGQDDFLKLLVAQLQNQDPLDPSDPTEFTAQLANYSQLEQLFNLNKSMDSLTESQQKSERLSALSMIGKDVLVQGSTFHLDKGPVEIGYKVDGQAEKITIHIRDASGRIVTTLHPLERSKGNHSITWSGRDLHGEPLPPGKYTLSIEATSIEGETVAVSPLVRVPVTGVDLGDNGALLLTDVGEFGLNDIYGVYDTTPRDSSSEEDNASEDESKDETDGSPAMDGLEIMDDTLAAAAND